MKSIVFVMVCVTGLAGCSNTQKTDDVNTRPDQAYQDLRKKILAQNQEMQSHQDQQFSDLEKKTHNEQNITPVLPRHNVLEDIYIDSLSVENGDLQFVLKALAEKTGTNLLLHPELSKEPIKLTLDFRQVKASQAFEEIMAMADLNGSVEGNVLKVSPNREAYFQLDFIETNTSADFDVGGDVLGGINGSSGASSSALSGNFRIKGKSSAEVNPYDALEKSVKGMLSKTGKMTLNRLSGTLVVQDRPSNMRNIETLVARFKKMLSRQILIDAQILEVSLSKGYEYGIDWSLLRNDIGVARGIGMQVDGNTEVISRTGNAALNEDLTISPQGLVFSNNDWIGAINVLQNFGDVHVVSNPSIRARHGQPAMISVGRSNSYISEVRTTVLGTGTTATTNLAQTQVQIEVSKVFDGLLLGVVPFIGDDGEISLSIHPIKSDVDQDSLELTTIQTASISLPKVDLKEISSTVQMHDGDTVVLGGLTDRRDQTVQSGVPFLSRLPVLGYLFKSETHQEVVRELVIVMQVRIL